MTLRVKLKKDVSRSADTYTVVSSMLVKVRHVFCGNGMTLHNSFFSVFSCNIWTSKLRQSRGFVDGTAEKKLFAVMLAKYSFCLLFPTNLWMHTCVFYIIISARVLILPSHSCSHIFPSTLCLSHCWSMHEAAEPQLKWKVENSSVEKVCTHTYNKKLTWLSFSFHFGSRNKK